MERVCQSDKDTCSCGTLNFQLCHFDVRRNLVYTYVGTCGNIVVFNYLNHQRDALELMSKCEGVIILFILLSLNVCSHV